MATSTSKPAGNAPKKEAPKEAPKAAAAATPPSGDRRMMAMIAAFAILSAGASAGAVYMVTRTQIHAMPAPQALHEREYPGPTFGLGDFIVNLGSVESRRFLKAKLSLGFNAHSDEFAKLKGEERHKHLEEFTEEMKLREPKVKDIVNTTLAGFSAAELSTSQGRQQLKQTLVGRLDRLMPPEYTLKEVYLEEFIIQ